MRKKKLLHRLRLIPVLLLLFALLAQPVAAVQMGDLNGDGVADWTDYLILARTIASWPHTSYLAINTQLADFNGDDILDGKDRTWFARALSGWQGYELPELVTDGLAAEDYYGRSTLALESDGENRQICYDYILGKLQAREEIIDFGNAPAGARMSQSRVNKIYEMVLADHPDLFWVTGEYSSSRNSNGLIVNLTPSYSVSAEDLPSMRAAFNDRVTSFTYDLCGPSMSEYEREKKIHDRIIWNCTYDENAENPRCYDAYGCLMDGMAQCQGYAKAFQVLLAKVGIQALYVSGQGNGGNHGWNIVRIDDYYYHVDVTWDDPIVQPGESDLLRNTYLNVPEEYIEEDHVIEPTRTAYELPVCTSWAANYYNVNGLVTTLELEPIETSISLQIGAGKGMFDEFEFFFPEAVQNGDITSFLNDYRSDICNQIIYSTDPSYSGNIKFGYSIPSQHVLIIQIKP